MKARHAQKIRAGIQLAKHDLAYADQYAYLKYDLGDTEGAHALELHHRWFITQQNGLISQDLTWKAYNRTILKEIDGSQAV